MKTLGRLVAVLVLVSALAVASEEPDDAGDWRGGERVGDGDTAVLEAA